MKLLSDQLRKRFPIIVFLIIYIVYAVLSFSDYGITLDEYFVYQRGQSLYTFYRGNDPSIQQSFTEKLIDDNNEIRNRNLLFKDSSYPAFLYIFNDSHSYEMYHLLNLLVASVSFWIVFEFLILAKVKPWQALIGPLLLITTPRFFGHLAANPKDMPYALAFLASLFFMFIGRKIPIIPRIVLLGIMVGATSSLRQVGFLLLPIYGAFLLFDAELWKLKRNEQLNVLVRSFMETVGIFLVSFGVLLFTYPYLRGAPLERFIELLQINASFPWNERVMIFGKDYYPNERPWYYLFVWFAITTPLFIMALCIASCKDFFKSRLKVLLGISLSLNILVYLLVNPTTYDGLRHFLFLLPQIVILAALAFTQLLKDSKIKKFVIGLTIVHVILIGYSYVTLYPYHYTYFNELIGGLPGADTQFETDYWGSSDKEAITWLNNYLDENNIDSARVASCSRSDSLQAYLNPQHEDVNSAVDTAEYFVCYGRFHSLDDIDGDVIHTVERQGVTLNTVIRVNQ